MFKALLLSLMATLTPLDKTLGDYPKNLPEPDMQVEEEQDSIRFWITLEPKCLIQTYSTNEGVLATEITVLDPEETRPSNIVDLVTKLEGIEEESQTQTFLGMDEDACRMTTSTNTGHFILWERNPKTGAINKVTILYHKESTKL